MLLRYKCLFSAFIILQASSLVFEDYVGIIRFQTANNGSWEDFTASAAYGFSFIRNNLTAPVALANPVNGCLPIVAPAIKGDWFALFERGGCDFDVKTLTAQAAGATAAIIYDSKDSDDLVVMRSEKAADMFTISSFFIIKEDGRLLNTFLSEGQTVLVSVFFGSIGFPDFLSVLFLVSCVCIVIIALCWAIRSYLSYRQRQQRRFHSLLSVENRRRTVEEQLVSSSWHPATHSVGECAICLEVFEEGAAMKSLPCCGGGFHASCINKWLIEKKLECPLCRQNPLTAKRSSSNKK